MTIHFIADYCNNNIIATDSKTFYHKAKVRPIINALPMSHVYSFASGPLHLPSSLNYLYVQCKQHDIDTQATRTYNVHMYIDVHI